MFLHRRVSKRHENEKDVLSVFTNKKGVSQNPYDPDLETTLRRWDFIFIVHILP